MIRKGETFLFNIFRETPPSDPQLSVQLINAGFSVVKSHAYHRKSHTPMYVWQYTEEGIGAIDLPDRTVKLTPGTSFFIYVPDGYTYYLPQKSSYWKFTYLSIGGIDAARLYEGFRQKHGMILHHEKNPEALVFARKVLSEIREQGLPDAYRSSVLAYEFLMTLFHEMDTEQQPSMHLLANRISREVMGHPEKVLPVTALARLCGYSRAHFSRIFHVENGVSPTEFVKELRIKIAAHLLETELISIKEIAYRTGFSTPEYFCRVFRLKYNCSPGDYRKNYFSQAEKNTQK